MKCFSLVEHPLSAMIFVDGKLQNFSEYVPDVQEKYATWSYSSLLEGEKWKGTNIHFLEADYMGKPLGSGVGEETLKIKWIELNKTLKAHISAFKNAKIDLGEVNFYLLLPEDFLETYYAIKHFIMEEAITTGQQLLSQEMYSLLLQHLKLADIISRQKLNIDGRGIKHLLTDSNVRNEYNSIRTTSPYIRYNVFGSVTGRWTTHKGSCPILRMRKDLRGIIKPRNHILVELDYNAAELRTAISLSGKEQPKEDLHNWHQKTLYKTLSRDECKKKLFSWLYNPLAEDEQLDALYDKKTILSKYYNSESEVLVTPYGRRIDQLPEIKAYNYLMQSSTFDMAVEQTYKVYELLKDSSSYIIFMLYDSILLDLARDDFKKLKPIIKTFANTRFGQYRINVRAGDAYGRLKELKI